MTLPSPAGPALRTNMVVVHVARRSLMGMGIAGGLGGSGLPSGKPRPAPTGGGLEFLQLRRTKEPMLGSWQPVMGGIEAGETALDAALRELREEVGLAPGDHLLSLHTLDLIRPFFIRRLECIMLAPEFVVEVSRNWTPNLNHEHDATRWVQEDKVEDLFLWPGQHQAVREAATILRGSTAAEHLRVPLG